MFDEVLTIESILQNEHKAVSTQKEGKIVFNIEDQEGNLVAKGIGGSVISALNYALKEYARKEGIEDIEFVHSKRDKDLSMKSFLESSSIFVESYRNKIRISYIKNENLHTSFGLRGIYKKDILSEKYTVLYGKNFRSVYNHLSDVQSSKNDIQYDLIEKIV